MPMEIWQKNLQILKIHRNELAKQLSFITPTGAYSSPLSKSGVPTLAYKSDTGIQKFLTSSYDPVKEARRSIESHYDPKIPNYIFYGMGLGYSLLEWNRLCRSNSKAFVFERDVELLRLAMESLDFELLIKNKNILFFLNASPKSLYEKFEEDQLLNFSMNGFKKITSKSPDRERALYYAELESSLEKLIQNKSIDLRTRKSFSKRFFDNIVSNWPYILSNPGINSLKDFSKGMPAIVVSAGPSLDKNIALLKEAQKRVLILAVGTALKPLLEKGIEPDFVFAVDPALSAFDCFKSLKIPKKIHLVFDPGTCPQIVEGFPGGKLSFDSNLELSRWLANVNEPKGSLGDMFSVAHTAFYFAHYLACDPVFLVGQDLCFEKNRLHCSSSHYNTLHTDSITGIDTVCARERQTIGKYDTSVLPARDIWGKQVVTLNNLSAYKNQFSCTENKNLNSFNASEGGIAIGGITNGSLRELLFIHCRKSHKYEIRKIGSQKVSPPIKLKSKMTDFVGRIEFLKKRLMKIESEYLSDFNNTEFEKNDFIREMESFYAELLEDADAVRLMQEYSYSAFVEWKRCSDSFTNDLTEFDLNEKKLERDKKFIPDLLSAMDYLSASIKSMADRISI